MRRSSLYLCITLGLLLLVAALTNFGFTQSKKTQSTAPPQEQAYRIITVTVKPGMGPEWENFLKNELIPAMKKGGVKQYGVWRTAGFGDPDNYLLTSPMGSLAELDDPSPLVKALGQDGVAALAAKRQRFVANARTYMITTKTNLSIAPKSGYVLKRGVLATNTIAPGRTEDFEKNYKEVVAAIGKANPKGVLTAKLGLGGNPNEYTTLILFDSFADLDKFVPAVGKALAEAKLAPQTGIVMHSERTVIMNIPELSIQPAAQ